MTVDLCVVNYRTVDKLERLLRTLTDGQQTRPYKLYVADNGSEDGSAEWLQTNKELFGIDEIVLNDNVGYSRACNDLASRGSSEYLALLNADVWLNAADVSKIESIFKEDETIAVLGPKQRNEQGIIRHAGIIGTNEAPRHRGWGELDPNDVLYRDRIDCVTVSGSAHFFRRNVWNNLRDCPLFRMASPEAKGAYLLTVMYYEETFANYHATAHGYRVVYDGSVSIGHTWSASEPPTSPVLGQYMLQSRDVFRAACDLHGISHD